MLIESVLAVVALITAAMLLGDQYTEMKGNPIALFAHSLGTLMTSFGIDYNAEKHSPLSRSRRSR
jgi:carbon starvation protein CstA